MKEIKIQWHETNKELPKESCLYVCILESKQIQELWYSTKYKAFNCVDYESIDSARKTWITPDNVPFWTEKENFNKIFQDSLQTLFERKYANLSENMFNLFVEEFWEKFSRGEIDDSLYLW